jgi:hypothetical protein
MSNATESMTVAPSALSHVYKNSDFGGTVILPRCLYIGEDVNSYASHAVSVQGSLQLALGSRPSSYCYLESSELGIMGVCSWDKKFSS